MNEEFLAAYGDFLQHADFVQLLEIARSRLAPRDFALLHDVLDAAIGQLENQVDKFTAVDLAGAAFFTCAIVVVWSSRIAAIFSVVQAAVSCTPFRM